MANTSDAAPTAPVSEATPNINSNETAQTANTEPVVLTNEQIAQYYGTTPEQVDKFNKFLDSNGKFDKVFEKTKQYISNPQSAPSNQPVTANIVSEPTPVAENQTAPVTPPKLAEGFITPTEIATLQYNNMLAAEYPELSEYITKGEHIKEATSLGMTVVDGQGNVNDKVLRQFLNLKKQTIQPPAPSEPVTATPLAEYTEVDSTIDSIEKAQQIMLQGVGHPKYQEAISYVRGQFYPSKKTATPTNQPIVPTK